MKILKIHFENINSLKGEFTIDLEKFLSDQAMIFAIIGPTGSGKTSILDAVCAALYGRTPRLQKLSDMSELMTHHTAQCFAEVTFSINQKSFRSRYERHRAGKKANGKLQDPSMELVDLEKNTIIAASRSKVLLKIEEITGLDFNRFCKSILLAQGNFNAFLTAKRDERAKLLEKITSTQIYSLISEKTYDKAKEEKLKLVHIREKLAQFKLLSEGDIQEIHKNIDQKKSEIKELKQNKDFIQKEKRYLEDLKECLQIKKNCQKELVDIESQTEQAASELEKLDFAKKTIPFIEGYERLKNLKLKCSDIEKQQAELNARIPELEKALDAAKQEKEKKEDEYLSLKKVQDATLKDIGEIEKMIPLIKERLTAKNQILNEKIALEKTIGNLFQDSETLSQNIKSKTKALNALQNNLQSLNNKNVALEKKKQVLGKKSSYETLEKTISDLEQELTQTNHLKDMMGSLYDKQKIIESHSSELSSSLNFLKKEEALFTQNSTKLDEQNKDLENLYKQRELEIKILELEAMRQELVKDEACPLCGSKTHPWQKKPPQKTNVTLSIEKSEKEVKHLSKKKEQSQIKIVNLKNCMDVAKANIATESTKVANLEKQIRNNPLSIDSITPDSLDKRVKSLSLSIDEQTIFLKAFKDVNAQTHSIQNKITQKKETTHASQLDLNQKIADQKLIQTELNFSKKEVAARESKLSDIDKKMSQIVSELEDVKGLPGMETDLSNPAGIEKVINATKQKMEQALNERKSQLNLIIQTIHETRAAGASHKKELFRVKGEHKKTLTQKIEQATAFENEIQTAGFSDMDAFETHRLPKEVLTELERKKTELSNARIKAATLQQNNDGKLTKLMENPVTRKTDEELELEDTKLERKIDEYFREQLALEQRVLENKTRKKAHEDILYQEKNQADECGNWEYLNFLIGQKDGAKFRMFAQDLTLQRLILKANTYLEMFSNRYLLKKNIDEELGITVVDTFFADRIRPIDNLSGGETFLVSLSLALGLSDITSRDTSIDSLFLDEGFGTLDQETLETALFALDTLNTFGKTVGIISHIESLKERIPLKIEVIPVSDGTSKINLVS
ncbi:MAG: AAA family ATPase [Desulfobacteraceae bacterium]|nr:AAA family ATPase [Desulfobacteraceae bacterium]